MADEKKTETTETTTAKKGGVLGNILTSIICLLIGAGAMFGIDTARVQEALDESLAKQIITDVTAVSVDQALADQGIASVLVSDEKKAEVKKEVIEKNLSSWEKLVTDAKAAVKAAKEAAKSAPAAVEEVKEKVEEIKDKLEGAKDAATDATATVTENAAPAAQ